MIIQAHQRVRLINGDVMTLGEAIEQQRLILRYVAAFLGPRGKKAREAWFADEPGTVTGFEVSRYLFNSRIRKTAVKGGRS